MFCPQCKAEIVNGAHYCSNCGAQLTLACPICAAQVQAGANFCAQCGAQIPPKVETSPTPSQISDPAPPPSPLPIQSEGYERRMVTILFADIAGYSTLSETLDPENLLEIMSRAYPCLLEPIKNHDGMVVQVMGDGVLAYFGTPIAKEDDPERAILAGLAITSRIQTYAQLLRQEQGLEKFNVRVGINTGLVVVGDLNPDRHLEYIALGDAVNLAARLQSIAPPDGVLISHETYRLVQGMFDVIPQEPVSVKGRQQLTQTYLVQQVHPFQQRQPSRGISGVETPMIGREPEMAALKFHYHDSIIGGDTALILVYGHAGIGKTRLSDTFIDWVAQQPEPPRILRGRAIATTQSMAFGILRNLFAKVFNILESDISTEALHKFRQGMQTLLDQDQADLVGQLVGFDFSSSSAVQQFIGDPAFAETAILYLTNFIRRLAKSRLLIVLEDLHWMDDSTLDLFTELVANLRHEQNNHLMILCTARPEFFERRENWGEGISGITQLNLRQLSRLRSRALIKDILSHVSSIPEELYDCVLDFTQGNPFFIEELIKMLIEGGVIKTADEEWSVSLDQLANLHVPPTLTGILQARLDSLSQPEKLVAQRASVIGRTFWDGSIRALTEEPGEAQLIQTHLSVLRDRGLVFQLERSTIKGNQEYLFKHALMRDAAYESVLLKHRRIYHAQAAAWIEENAGERIEEHLSLIAGHYETAGELEKSAVYYERAGAAAKLVNAHDQTINAARKAIGLFEQLPASSERKERIARLYEMCGDGLTILAQYEPAHQAFLTALSMISEADTLIRADVERKIGIIFDNQRIGYDLIAAQYEKAARLLGEPDHLREPAWWQTWLNLQNDQLMLLYWWHKADEYSHKWIKFAH
jgi:class 3 adenylate cyclase/tetratricopeptide (TPR) repeat protein